jgi:hypothetical protein
MGKDAILSFGDSLELEVNLAFLFQPFAMRAWLEWLSDNVAFDL